MRCFSIHSHSLLQGILVLVFLMIYFGMVDAMAQRSATEAELIKLTGKISCYDPMNGTLASVVIYNINQGKGSISEEDGSFTIDMARTDTIVFSTAEHKDYSYVIEKDPDFIDHSIEVIMLTDAIWLDAV